MRSFLTILNIIFLLGGNVLFASIHYLHDHHSNEIHENNECEECIIIANTNNYVTDYLEEFYEYCLVIKKCTSAYSFSNKKEINFSFLTQLVSKVMTSEETAIEVRPGFQHKEEGINSKTAPFQTQYNTSQSLLNTVTNILNTISISEMFSLSIQDLKMELAWTGDQDTGFLNSLEGVSKQLEKDEDNKHHLVVMLSEKVVAVPGSRIERDELITIISDKFNQSKFRLLETIENGEEDFDPLILQIDSIEKAHKFTKWVSGLAGNIIVRKVEVNNQLNIQDSNAVFHIAVFKDNFHS